jgi:hypothetical protein
MPTMDEDDLITWAHTEPSPDQLQNASDLADELSEAAFTKDIETAREKAILIVGLLWPASN